MSFVKESQTLPLEGTDVAVSPMMPFAPDYNDLRGPTHPSLEDIFVGDEEVEAEPHHLHVEPEQELVLTLDKIPGALDQEDLPEPEEIEVDEPEEVTVNDDPWDWGKTSNFLPWLSKKMQDLPQHSGRDTAGLERMIAYFETLDRLISKAVRTDINNEIAIDAVEKARDEIQRGLERLEERLEQVKASKYPKNKKKKNKKADEDQDGLVKEAQKATHVGGIVVSVPLLISGLARVCINGMVSAGHDIEDMFKKLSKKFNLTTREQFELIQLLQDMNYPVRRDRGFLLDEEIDTTSSDGFDWNANYPA